MCLVHRGLLSTSRGVQYLGGYHEYIRGYHRGASSVHRGDIMSTPGICSASEGYHE